MKKFKLGLIALALTLGVGGAFATTGFVHRSKAASLFWYPVNPTTNKTTGPDLYNDTKANVIAEQSCKDVAGQPICLYGSPSSSVPTGTNVGSPAPADRILENN
jgi:hypothetical protein